MTDGHGGNLRALAERAGLDREAILDFSASVNPLGPPESLRGVLSRAVDRLVHYPDPDSTELILAIAHRYQLPPDRIVVGNGSSELFHAIVRALPFDRAVIPVPTYVDYASAAEAAGRAVEYVPLDPHDDFAIDWESLAAHLANSSRGASTTPLSPCGRGVGGEGAAVAGRSPDSVVGRSPDRPTGSTEGLPSSASEGSPAVGPSAGSGDPRRTEELCPVDESLLTPAPLPQGERGDVVFLGQPNNPTGRMFDGDRLLDLAGRHPETTFVVDEAFADFVDGYVSLAQRAPDSVIVVRSLTKFYAIPGLRLGFAVAAPEIIERIRRQLPPWSVNTLAQEAGCTLLADEEYARRTVQVVAEERQALSGELSKLPGLYVYPGAANYLLVRLNRADRTAGELADRLLGQGIAIRTFSPGQHLDGSFFRVAVRTAEENRRFCDALAAALGVPSASRAVKKTPALMIQGTSSNAGKSVLTAALCRILFQDGIRVAPFKSQNMSLNSFIARDGGEMGRAQVVQAQACRLEPDVRMNPVLLKPNSDTGCQVIVRGQPVGNMRVGEYVRYKPEAFAAAKECYDSLAAEFDAVLLEGAGSPGEVNLKSHDIVNMRMAEYAAAPVLIVGDIDRGGVFASFVGTMEVLAAWERRLVAGWIVNRFRGDASLLAPALDYTLQYTGRPVLGVVPYLAELNLPEEDSVEFKSGRLDRNAADAVVEIAVIDLPHISNFTDFDALRIERDVRLRIVRSADELGRPDAVILPGSKNTLGDLDYLRRSGLAEPIAALARADAAEIVGICGGLQILGREICDPLGIESAAERSFGLGLLGASTVLAAEKTLSRVTAVHAMSGEEVTGYEIHHGQTSINGCVPWLTRPDGEVVGAASPSQRVWGTYLHGVFDADRFRRWFVDRLRMRRGLVPAEGVAARYDIEPALDRLADMVRRSLRIDDVYRLMGLR